MHTLQTTHPKMANFKHRLCQETGNVVLLKSITRLLQEKEMIEKYGMHTVSDQHNPAHIN
jgi:hypothetical protein